MPTETLEEDEAQNMHPQESFLSEKTMTFEQVAEKSWEIAGERLETWKCDLEVLLAENAPALVLALSHYSVLYAQEVPEIILVSLNYYPGEGRQKGEPVRNFWSKGRERLPKDFPDLVFWMSDPHRLPTDTSESYAQEQHENYARVPPFLLHETQHQIFQGDVYEQILALSKEQPSVQRTLEKLEKVRGTYANVANELITTYLEVLGKELLQEDMPTTDTDTKLSPFQIKTDKKMHGEVLEAVIKADVEDWRDRGRHPGPYTDLRQGWSHELGGLPSGYEVLADEVDVTLPRGLDSHGGQNIYQISRSLDTSLARRYVIEGKPIDVAFVTELYAMVEERLDQEAN